MSKIKPISPGHKPADRPANPPWGNNKPNKDSDKGRSFEDYLKDADKGKKK